MPKFAADLANAHEAEVTQAARPARRLGGAAAPRLLREAAAGDQGTTSSRPSRTLQAVQEKSGVIVLDKQAEALIAGAALMRAQISEREVQLKVLRTSATEQNPAVIRLNSELRALRGELARMESTQGGAAGSAVDMPVGRIPEAAVDYVRARRELKLQETLLESMVRQYEIAKLDEAKEGPALQQVDVAVPPDAKSKPSRLLDRPSGATPRVAARARPGCWCAAISRRGAPDRSGAASAPGAASPAPGASGATGAAGGAASATRPRGPSSDRGQRRRRAPRRTSDAERRGERRLATPPTANERARRRWPAGIARDARRPTRSGAARARRRGAAAVARQGDPPAQQPRAVIRSAATTGPGSWPARRSAATCASRSAARRDPVDEPRPRAISACSGGPSRSNQRGTRRRRRLGVDRDQLEVGCAESAATQMASSRLCVPISACRPPGAGRDAERRFAPGAASARVRQATTRWSSSSGSAAAPRRRSQLDVAADAGDGRRRRPRPSPPSRAMRTRPARPSARALRGEVALGRAAARRSATRARPALRLPVTGSS